MKIHFSPHILIYCLLILATSLSAADAWEGTNEDFYTDDITIVEGIILTEKTKYTSSSSEKKPKIIYGIIVITAKSKTCKVQKRPPKEDDGEPITEYKLTFDHTSSNFRSYLYLIHLKNKHFLTLFMFNLFHDDLKTLQDLNRAQIDGVLQLFQIARGDIKRVNFKADFSETTSKNLNVAFPVESFTFEGVTVNFKLRLGKDLITKKKEWGIYDAGLKKENYHQNSSHGVHNSSEVRQNVLDTLEILYKHTSEPDIEDTQEQREISSRRWSLWPILWVSAVTGFVCAAVSFLVARSVYGKRITGRMIGIKK